MFIRFSVFGGFWVDGYFWKCGVGRDFIVFLFRV